MEKYKMTEQEFQELANEDISVKRHKALMEKADERMGYIAKTLESILGHKWEWFDFDNCGSNDGEPIRGFFDIVEYSDTIRLAGDFQVVKYGFEKYESEFPTEWLYTDFEKDVKAEFTAYQDSVNAKLTGEKKAKAEKAAEIQSIENSLRDIQVAVYKNTPAEMRNNFVFLSAEQIYEAKKKVENPKLEAVRKMLEDQKTQLREILSPEQFMAIRFKEPEVVLAAQEKKEPKKNKM